MARLGDCEESAQSSPALLYSDLLTLRGGVSMLHCPLEDFGPAVLDSLWKLGSLCLPVLHASPGWISGGRFKCKMAEVRREPGRVREATPPAAEGDEVPAGAAPWRNSSTKEFWPDAQGDLPVKQTTGRENEWVHKNQERAGRHEKGLWRRSRANTNAGATGHYVSFSYTWEFLVSSQITEVQGGKRDFFFWTFAYLCTFGYTDT